MALVPGTRVQALCLFMDLGLNHLSRRAGGSRGMESGALGSSLAIEGLQ